MKNEQTGPAPSALRLEFNAKAEGAALVAGYRATNLTDRPVYLLNVLWHFADSGIAKDPREVYVSARTDRLLHLGKLAPPPPRKRRIELRIIPYARKLDPGASVGEVMRLPLPVEEYNPYFRDKPQWRDFVAEGVLLSLQYVRADEKLTEKPAPVDGALVIWHPQLLNRIETARSSSVRLAIPVRVRTDEFERF